MDLIKKWGFLLALGCLLGAQTVDDPVMKARVARAQAQGIAEADLPPVPRGVMEPPPLPPPEIHAKDMPHSLAARPSRRHRGRQQHRGAVSAPTRKVKAAKHARPVGKNAVRRTGKRGKS